MNTTTADACFDRNQIKDFINRVEDDAALFIGAEFGSARLIGFISKMHALQEVSDTEAASLLRDAHHQANLVALGHRYVKMVRKPSAEMRIMILSDEAKRRQ